MKKSKTTKNKQTEKPPENSPVEKVKLNNYRFLSRPFIQRIQTAGQIEQERERARKDIERGKMIEKVVKEIDALIIEPGVMAHWREQITIAFQRPVIKNFRGNNGTEPLIELFRNLNDNIGIDVLYLILAFCHDDFIPFKIIDEKLRQLSPNICEDKYAYGRQGLSNKLDVFLNRVKADIDCRYKPITPPASISKESLEVRVARVVTKTPYMKSADVAKLAEVKGKNAAGIIRGTKAWQNRKTFRPEPGASKGGKTASDTSGGYSSAGKQSDVVGYVKEPQAEHIEINEMIKEYDSGERKTPPTPKDISEKLSTSEDPVTEERAKELLKETNSLFGY